MRIFVTGATGFVGSAVVRDLLDHGHQVLGLARGDAGAAALTAAGAQVHRADLSDLDALRAGAALSDGVVHTAFNHDFANFAASCALDRDAIQAMGEALAGSNRPLIVTSGTGVLNPGGLTTEQTPPPAENAALPRESEAAALAFTTRGVRASVVRLPPSVHGDGDHAFVPLLIGLAREKGHAAYIGDGLNTWPAVHRLDAAKVYRLILENPDAGTIFHATAEPGVAMKEIATIIARRLNLPAVSLKPDEAAEYYGWFTYFASLNNKASSTWTQQTLGWHPTHPTLLTDLDHPRYFPT